MNVDEIYTHQPTGKQVRIVSLDSDPECDVMVVPVANPDKTMMVSREELVK